MSQLSSTPSRRRFLRVIAFILAGILVLLIAVYLVGTSSGFLKAVVLPRVGAAIHADVTAQEISLRPFSKISLRKMQVRTTGDEPLIAAESAEVRYDLFAILRGTIDVDGISVNGATVNVIQEPDGKSNLDPLLKKDEKPAPTAQTPQLAIRNVSLKGATLRHVRKHKDGAVESVQLKNLDLTLDQLANGQAGKLILSSTVELANRPPTSAGATNDLVAGKIAGSFDFSLDRELLPQTVQGNLRLDISQGEGAYRDLNGLVGNLTADLTPSDIRQLSLQFERGGRRLGQVLVNGPIDLSKSEARLDVAIQSIDRQVLNLAGAAQGWDFGDTTLNATNLIEITAQGSKISASGTVAGSKVTLIQGKGSTPPIDLAIDYQTAVNLADKSAVVQRLTLAGRQNQHELLRANLDRPMSLAWGSSTAGLPDSTFQLALSQFDLKAWQALLGTNLPSGTLDVQLSLRSQQNGKLLATQLTASIQDLTLSVGANLLERAQARLELTGEIEELKRVKLDRYQFDVQQRNQSLAKGSGSGRYDLSSQDANIQISAEVSLPNLLRQFPTPDLQAAAGSVKFHSTVTQQSGRQQAAGKIDLNDFTGQYAAYKLQNFHAALDYDVDSARGVVEIRRAAAALQQGNTPGGNIEITGRYHLTNAIADLSFKLSDLNQNGLRPFLTPSLGEMKLVSISLNGHGTAKYDANGESALKAELILANWLAEDPKIELPKTPLSANLQVDGSLRQAQVDLRQFVVALRQGNASAGNIDLNGKYNLTNQAAQVAFKIAGLDQTALRPALASALGENKLLSVLVNANGSAGYDPNGDSDVKASVQVANLVVQDPKQTLPRTPLAAELQMDGSLRRQVLDLRQFLVKLAPTQRAKNELQIQGRLDLKGTNASPSQLAIRAESLDVTPYYDLFAVTAGTGTNAPAAAAKPAISAQPSPRDAGQPQEPEPISLPVQQFTGDLKIDRFYLRELAATNLQTTVKISGGAISLSPVQLTLNGAPLRASITANLGVPGYQYDLSLNADRLPIEPLVNSFSPASAGRYRGDLIAQAQIKGAGTTGASLQKNLSGQASLSLTNMNLEIVGPKIRRLLDPIALALRVPELTQTPLNWVAANTTLGQGRVDVNQFSVLSHAFYAEGQGAVRIAEVLTNSPVNIPVNLALRRSLAEKARLIPSDAPTNTAYVTLPSFVTLAGTLGDPKAEINKLALAGLLAQTAARIPKVGGDAGAILEGIGGILSGQRPSLVNTNLPRQTNAPPATNKPAPLNPLDLLRILPQKK